MKLLGYCVLVSLVATCTCNAYKESEKQTFDIIEKYIDGSCTLYLMFFWKGEYMYTIGTMDSCKNLTKDEYVASYDSLITDNLDKILVKRGKIIFETDFSFGGDSIFRNRLINITEKKFNATSRLIDEDSEGFTIELK